MLKETIDYSLPGPLTTLDPTQIPLTLDLPPDPVGICAAVGQLIVHPFDALPLALPEQRLAEQSIRPTSGVIRALTTLDPAPLNVPRPVATRVVGTCRTFATFSCALLRLRGIPARARCGFATYFEPGKSVDHWITEYWQSDQHRWVRVDAEVLDRSVVAAPDDLQPGEFLTGGEAWPLYRDALVDGSVFGVANTDNWGPAEIRGNAIRDLAALQKIEMLPWDEWGRMEASYQGKTGADYDALIDKIATTCASGQPQMVAELYFSEDLAVPAELVS